MFNDDYFAAHNYKQSYTTNPTSALIPCITKFELADYLRADDANEPIIERLVNASTQALINYLQIEIVERQRVVTYPNYPSIGTSNGRGLSAPRLMQQNEIALPYTRLLSVERVELYGAEINDYTIKQTTPASIELDDITFTGEDLPSLVINYTAGFGPVESVPEDIKFACTMLAAYIYDNRGCGMMDAFINSGAKQMTQSYSNAVFVL